MESCTHTRDSDNPSTLNNKDSVAKGNKCRDKKCKNVKREKPLHPWSLHVSKCGDEVSCRAKDIAMKQIRGDHQQQYAILRDYALELKEKNKDTTVKAPVAGPYTCQILTAVLVDNNNGIYPLAYAIVEAECKSSWLWFLTNLGEDLDLQPNSNYTFISDRQKFEKLIEDLKCFIPKAHEWLQKIPPSSWARDKLGEGLCGKGLSLEMVLVMKKRIIKGLIMVDNHIAIKREKRWAHVIMEWFRKGMFRVCGRLEAFVASPIGCGGSDVGIA
ncbi:transposase, MuDR, MULE transposase domain protein [Tanacetum coccineum]